MWNTYNFRFSPFLTALHFTVNVPDAFTTEIENDLSLFIRMLCRYGNILIAIITIINNYYYINANVL